MAKEEKPEPLKEKEEGEKTKNITKFWNYNYLLT